MKGLKSIVVLLTICVAVAALLAAVNRFTAPVIAENEAAAAQKAMTEVMPGGTDFEAVALPADIPSGITEVYRSGQGGYVFTVITAGYSSGLKIMCGISAEGKVTGTKTLASSETPTLGGQTEQEGYRQQYVGKDDLSGIDGISGATMTSNAYRQAVSDCLTAFAVLKGGES